MINITLPDDSIRQYPQGTTPYEIALSISEGLARNVLAAKVNDKTVDTSYPINHDARLWTAQFRKEWCLVDIDE